ncbi:LUD domain-containing protein [Streptomyces sp. S.PNR 29]|uniref:LutC/YkgG family protein n=1 Tax=Streptomyces sp. S.PNR 29 TaxID=2973805 RepID=UPI0025B16C3E|nr:LUD domain-containing protein [Streptomyces sp. S.PNR 29]MDN0201280.1 LUD domain-containing protein [Streptomyces sp. S.PNR 29]
MTVLSGKGRTTARTEVLRRIRHALRDIPESERDEDAVVSRDYSLGGPLSPGSPEAVDLLAARLADYGASVRLVSGSDVAATIARSAGSGGSVVVPEGFPPAWRSALPPERVLTDVPRLSVAELDRVSAVVTTVALAIATTGTLVLDGGPGQGRRALTLVPDVHVCVVRAAQVVASVPEALARLEPARPLTFVSGPSATSDIELDRVEGVHGPRRLDAFIVV